MFKKPAIYILASKRNGTLYVGVTSFLAKRVWEHKNNLANGFTKRYKIHTLVYYELYADMEHAIAREEALKNWQRSWKVQLIESVNPTWKDLFNQL